MKLSFMTKIIVWISLGQVFLEYIDSEKMKL
jgi:hypothetical protein